jgi:hypothetical protein
METVALPSLAPLQEILFEDEITAGPPALAPTLTDAD